jgi:hypothetical protein
MNMTSAIRLPKSIESDPRTSRLLGALTDQSRLLWPGGTVKIPEARLNDALKEVLLAAYHAGQVARSLQKVDQRLAAEARGQGMADQKSGVPRGQRISRLLILASDGAERFYRQGESLLQRHGSRVMAVRLHADAEQLGGLLYGPGRAARLLMMEHKAAVGAALLALADQWTTPEDGD